MESMTAYDLTVNFMDLIFSVELKRVVMSKVATWFSKDSFKWFFHWFHIPTLVAVSVYIQLNETGDKL